MYRSQGVDRTSVAPGSTYSGAYTIAINGFDPTPVNENSDWAMVAMVVYSRKLTVQEIVAVEDWWVGVAL